jgi:hypothetical protein
MQSRQTHQRLRACRFYEWRLEAKDNAATVDRAARKITGRRELM